MRFFNEELYTDYNQKLLIESMIVKKKSKYQKIEIFNSKKFGKVMSLDKVIQITENDHHGYSEMLTHVPILTHNNVKKVLIIGGGDGAIAHEVLKYSTIEKIIICEIDEEVIKLSKKYLYNINFGSLNNIKVNILINDAFKFVSKNKYKNYFDLIIVDRPDPIGPGKKLFQKIFYQNIKNIINKNGIAVFQNGVPFFQKTELKKTSNNLKNIFQFSGVYLTVVPSYIGGYMALTWASDKTNMKKKFKNNIYTPNTKYYTQNLHNSSFKLPNWIEKIVK
tara:strand:- start:16320 stop:17153 length:834 start_codon:yes stop_codon:yes gene_type:complete